MSTSSAIARAIEAQAQAIEAQMAADRLRALGTETAALAMEQIVRIRQDRANRARAAMRVQADG